MNGFKSAPPGDDSETDAHLSPVDPSHSVNVPGEVWVDVPKGMRLVEGVVVDSHGVMRDAHDDSVVVNHHKCKEHGRCEAVGIQPDEIIYADNGAPWCPQCYPIHQNCRLRLNAEKKHKQEIQESLDRSVNKGFLEKLPDGTYKPTELGRIVAKQSGTEN